MQHLVYFFCFVCILFLSLYIFVTVDRAKFVRSPSNSSRNPKLDLLYLTCGDSAQNLIEYVLDLSTQKI